MAFHACPGSSRVPPGTWRDLIEEPGSNPFLQGALETDPSIPPIGRPEGDASPRTHARAGSREGSRGQMLEGSVQNGPFCPADKLLQHFCSRLKHCYQPVGI